MGASKNYDIYHLLQIQKKNANLYSEISFFCTLPVYLGSSIKQIHSDEDICIKNS